LAYLSERDVGRAGRLAAVHRSHKHTKRQQGYRFVGFPNPSDDGLVGLADSRGFDTVQDAILGGSGEAPGQETAIAAIDGWTVILDEQCRFE
jgi:hypothetical protein